MSDTREIPVSTYFPDGMKSVGSVHDELTMGKAVKRVGVVDLGTLNWTYNAANTRFYTMLNTATFPTSYSTKANISAANYEVVTYSSFIDAPVNMTVAAVNASGNYLTVRNTAYTDAAAFKAAMDGVMLYYELAEPVETEITPPLTMTYTVENGGTESIVIPTGENSAAPTLAIVYGLTADGVVDKALSVIAPIEGATAATNYSANA